MEISSSGVKAVVEPTLWRGPACAVTLSALVDNAAGTVLFFCEAREPSTGRLQGLWSASPAPIERYLEQLHEAHSEFLKLLWDASGPFA